MTTDLRDRVNAICTPLPGAELTHPFDNQHDAWKVGGKMFTCIGAKMSGVSVKTPDIESARMMIEGGAAERAPYFHRSWVHLPPQTDEELLRGAIHRSYSIVRSGLTKKLQASLGPFEAGRAA
jgi:predicted DNA-binding protein (MmcQ/YjbR family)